MPRYLPNPPYKISTEHFHNNIPCWDWLGATRGGYGTYTLTKNGYKTCVQATRIWYEKIKGIRVPHTKQLDHLCRRRICINPEHLEIINNDLNCQRGNLAILNEIQVKEIRTLYENKSYNQTELAVKFGVAQSTIHVIVTRKQWQNV